MTELKVTAHLMTLESGLFSIIQTPSRSADPALGLPGVRLSPPPGPASRPDAVRIAGFQHDGWLSGTGDAALVRVTGGPAQLLVTIYQAPGAAEGPNLQVTRLLDGAGTRPPAEPQQIGAVAPRPGPQPRLMEMVAHIQERGDVGAMLGEWLGERGSKRWIEGFALAPNSEGLSPKDIEYQAVLGQGWLSPWSEGGEFCGSRGMALPVLGLRVRLRGETASTHDVRYSGTFVDGSEIGPVQDGEPCEAESLAALESFQVLITAKGQAAPPDRRKATREVPEPAAEPAPVKPRSPRR